MGNVKKKVISSQIETTVLFGAMQNWAYISIEKQGKRNVGSLDYPVALVNKREDFIVQNVDF